MAKLSLIIVYYRLNPLSTIWRISVYTVAIIILVSTPVLMLMYVFGCQPLAMAWYFDIGGGRCISRVTIIFTSSVINIVTDFLMVLIPIPLIYGLSVPACHKLGAIVMFSLGCLYVCRLPNLYAIS